MAAARLCLKARPTPSQLADRLRPVDGLWPDGLELYLAARDLVSTENVDQISSIIRNADVPDGFAWLIEGPVDSLDGADFDVTRESPADYAVLERLASLAARIHARAVNIHVISPSPDLERLTAECRRTLLEKSVPFLARFVTLIQDAGAVPTVENMPPVLRMRRSDFAFTPIGMASADLRWLADQLPGLATLGDTSHAGLYLNARSQPPDSMHSWSAALAGYLRSIDEDATDLVSYLAALPRLENAQISNAAGLLGEGLPYAEGDFDLDPPIRWLNDTAKHIVTETLEPNNDHAVIMRDALRRMRAALA